MSFGIKHVINHEGHVLLKVCNWPILLQLSAYFEQKMQYLRNPLNFPKQILHTG